MRAMWLCLGAGLLAGCAPAVRTPAVPVVVADTVPTTAARAAVAPLRVTQAFQRAVARGTRTMDGRPGTRYWQQRVDYRIHVELDPATALLSGEQVVVYANQSPDTLRTMLVHLYQNAFSPGVPRVRPVPVTGGVRVGRVAVNDVELRQRPAGGRGAGYSIDGTLLWIELARPLPPGGSVELEMSWQLTVPPAGAPRTGHADREAFVVAQWYPQVAVYDDLRGWHAVPYWTNGEFYQMYGDFEVSITVPEGWLVAATGQLDNPDEVLTPETAARLERALARDDIVRVVTVEDAEQQRATMREPGGQLTWRFRARDVRDFAFATSNRYVWDATRATWPGASTPVLVSALYRPDAEHWREAATYMRHSLTFHASRWGPYIYPHITAAEGPIGGMEYPMLVFIGRRESPQSLYSVLNHEIAHSWWPMMVGSNESLHAWQDEGPASYVRELAITEYFPGAEPALTTQRMYLDIAGSDVERPIMTHPDLFGSGPQYVVAAYRKPATLLRALGAVIGEDVVHAGLREYTTRWLLRHPAPYDFFNTIAAVADRDLDWFWGPWFQTTDVLDHAIAAVRIAATEAGERADIVIEDRGGVPMPVLIVVTLADGTTQAVTLPVEPWLAGERTQTTTLAVTGRITRVEIDPGRYLPYIERGHTLWTRQ